MVHNCTTGAVKANYDMLLIMVRSFMAAVVHVSIIRLSLVFVSLSDVFHCVESIVAHECE